VILPLLRFDMGARPPTRAQGAPTCSLRRFYLGVNVVGWSMPGAPAANGLAPVFRYLAVRNLDEYRGPTVGTRSSGWKQALQAFTIYFEGRIPTP
jgi:hypothetical protein